MLSSAKILVELKLLKYMKSIDDGFPKRGFFTWISRTKL